MAKPVYSFEVATNAPTALWKVADRVFHDRRLTLGEKRRCLQVASDEAFLAAALTCLKVDGDDLTVEWLEEALSEQQLREAVAYVLNGQAGVDKYRQGQAGG